MSKGKRKRGLDRLNELLKLAGASGMSVEIFSPIHVRVHGTSRVDYWPTTAKAWRLGNAASMQHVGPEEVIAMAKAEGVEHIVEQAAAVSHMRSIAQEDGLPPW